MRTMAYAAFMLLCAVAFFYIAFGRDMLPHDEWKEACEQSQELCKLAPSKN